MFNEEDDEMSSSDEMNLMTEALFRASDGFRREFRCDSKLFPSSGAQYHWLPLGLGGSDWLVTAAVSPGNSSHWLRLVEHQRCSDSFLTLYTARTTPTKSGSL